MKIKYSELKQKHSNELNDFPMFFAFSMKQFDEGLEKLNTTKDQIQATAHGGYIKASDETDLLALFERHETELSEAMTDDVFLKDAIIYELGNHEYGYTGNPDDALYALGIKLDSNRNRLIFLAARKQFLATCED